MPRLTLGLRAGAPIDVIDVSAAGVLIETAVRLEPGTSVAIRPHPGRGGVSRQARVVHCHVCSIDRRYGIRFRAGLQFDAGSDYTASVGLPGAGNELPGHRLQRPARQEHRVELKHRRGIGTQVD